MPFIKTILDMFSGVSDYLNPIINLWMPWVILILTGLLDLLWIIRWVNREGARRGAIKAARCLAIEGAIFFLVYLLPKLIVFFVFLIPYVYFQFNLQISENMIRWVLLYAVCLPVFSSTRKYGGSRGLFSYLGHLSALLAGWLIGKWVGILFFSIPILTVYYICLYYFAQAIIPVFELNGSGLHFKDILSIRNASQEFKNTLANDNTRILLRGIFHLFVTFIDAIQLVGGEKWQRFLVLVWFTWGLQYPIVVVTDPFGREHSVRIKGNSRKSLGRPGLVYAQAHQAVGITTGVRFSRIAGPGLIFNNKPFESLYEVVDLRRQQRRKNIDAVSQDGHPFQATLSASFCIDSQDWNLADTHRLKAYNPVLEEGKEFAPNTGSYPYSPARVRAALGTTGVTLESNEAGTALVHWDDQVMSHLEEAARFVLAQRNLDELWKPKNDEGNSSALDEISKEIEDLTRPHLKEKGVDLRSARIVSYIFPKDHPIIRQKIKSWSELWEQRGAQAIARGNAEAGRLQQEAKAYARSILLTSLAEGLPKTSESRPDLARNIIASRFIGALEELIEQQPTETRAEYLERMETIKQQILIRRNKG